MLAWLGNFRCIKRWDKQDLDLVELKLNESCASERVNTVAVAVMGRPLLSDIG